MSIQLINTQEDEFTGRSVVYPLHTVSNPRIHGTATFEELVADSITGFPTNGVKITLDLSNTPENGYHPAHIHMNAASEGGPISISLNSVNGETGKSITFINRADDGTLVDYDKLLTFDGHINVYVSDADLTTIVAQGNIGKNLAQVSIFKLIDLEHSLLVEALELTNLDHELKDSDEFTLFAPTNNAFQNLLSDLGYTSLTEFDVNVLTDILKNHIMLTKKKFTELLTLGTAKSINDYDLTFTDELNLKKVNDSYVVDTDYDFPDAMMHVIDKVLVPHQVVLPDIVDILSADVDFTTFVQSILSTNLVSLLRSAGPFTVFAPTTEAITTFLQSLGLASLAEIDNQLLIDIVLNHIIPANINSGDLIAIQQVETLSGEEILIEVENGTVTINDSSVVINANTIAKNGIIHTVDEVILPINANQDEILNLKIVSVNHITNEVVLKNFGTNTVDISDYRLCSEFVYGIISHLHIVEGDLVLEPMETLKIMWYFLDEAADLCLYVPTGSFGNGENLLNFVQWGSPGNGREYVANLKGVWLAGTYLTGNLPYIYIGDGTQTGLTYWMSEI